MYEILVYLFENYQHPTSFPENKALFRKLSAVGFDSQEIREALTWLSKLQQTLQKASCLQFSSLKSFRIFDKNETKHFDVECQNFLHFLESSGVIDASSRELIIDLAMTAWDHQFTVQKLKVITLIVLWSGDKMPDALILDELLLADQVVAFH